MASEPSRRTLYDKLLAAIDELIAAYDDAALHAPSPPPLADEVTVTAGPFASADELRSFRGSLSNIPGVRDVQIRGYAGTDRAIIDVVLGRPTRGSALEGDSVT